VNAIHSADDEVEALHYLKAIDPDLPAQFIAACHKGFGGDPFTKLVLHEGKRATTYIVFRDGKPCILKVFSECEDGSLSLLNEKRASQEFSGQTWFPEIYATGTNWILQEYFDQSCRLDRQAKTMETEDRLDIAGKVVSVISQLHEMGFAHRDIHGGNFFIVDGVIKLIDYETLIEEDKNIPIENCYDISGKGLESPFLTAWMCYSNTKEPSSLNKLLDVSFADAYRNMQTKQ
jgi:serine/threonine protein kinase